MLPVVALPLTTGAAEIRGTVIHPTRPGVVSDLEVRLLGLTEDSEPIRSSVRTDSEGSFHFVDLPEPAAYLVAASYDGISFPGGTVSFRAGEAPSQAPLVFHIYDRTTDATALSAPMLSWVIEREAGVYQVSQSLSVRNGDSRVVVVEAGEPPLLRMPLAPGHGEVRAALGRLAEGVSIVDGSAELRGPLLPGESEVRLRYELPLDGMLETEVGALQPTAAAGGWPDGAPRIERLELYLKDFGIAVDAGTLHPARPARSGDVIYLAFLGFELEPGTRYPLRVSPLSPAPAPPVWSTVLLVALLAGVSLYVVGRPVAMAATEPVVDAQAPGELEKRALQDALADLDFDFETGKLSVEDRDRLRAELTGEAVRSLARRRGLTRGKTLATEEPRCTCGHQAREGDKFCAACGRPL